MLPKYERLVNKQALSIATLNRDYNYLDHLVKTNHVLQNDKYNFSALDYAKLYNLKDAVSILRKIR
jgi:uncharacterized protein